MIKKEITKIQIRAGREMEKPSTEEAIKTIKEWGVDCDNFIANNYVQYLQDGDPYDNSHECADYFLECLKIVCDLGIKANETQNEKATLNQNRKD